MLVLYADDESFTLSTPQGHMYASWITFSSYQDETAGLVAQVQMLLRAGDPIFDVIMRLGGFRFENRVWQHTLRALARRFDVYSVVDTEETCLDRRVQWAYVPNIWYNAGIRTFFYAAASPVRRALPSSRRSTLPHSTASS
jgi:hypothetical protein